MSDNFIPNFKKSGDGVAKDILKLKKIEAISEGWYRGQLIQLLDKVAGRIIVDGVECYNTNITINGSTSTSDTSERGKNIRKLLKLFGIQDSGLSSIYNTFTGGQVSGILMNFNKAEDVDRDFTISEFKETLKNLKKLLIEADRLELTHSNKTYDGSITIRPAVESSSIYTGSAWVEDLDFYGELQDYRLVYTEDGTIEVPIQIARDFSIGQAMHFSELKIFNSSNVDITSTYNIQLVDCVKMLLVVSGSSFLELESIAKLSEELIIPNTEYDSSYYIVTSKCVYNKIYNETFADTQFNRYKHGSLQVKQYDGETYFNLGIIANHYWNLFLHLDSFDNDLSNDLFYISKREVNLLGTETRYITISGIKKQSVNQIAFGIARYCDFQFVIPRKKKKFFGIGGFVGGFLGGLFNAIISFVAVIAKVLARVPIVKLQLQLIGWIFSGEWTNDQKKIDQISTRVLLGTIAAVITIMTVGVGWQLALSLLTSAFGMYTGLKSYDDLVESLKRQEALKKQTADNEIFDKLTDFSKDVESSENANYAMYKPFDKINNTYKSPFAKNGIHNPKFGLK